MSTSAKDFKAVADNLFRQQQYESACRKYSDAIQEDDKNPILFANRALCGLKLGRYLDADADAKMVSTSVLCSDPHSDASKQAVELDASYVKAHIRLAEANDALQRYWISERAWSEALDAIEDGYLSPNEALRQACERGSSKARNKLNILRMQVEGKSKSTREFSAWHRAMALCGGFDEGRHLYVIYPFGSASSEIFRFYKISQMSIAAQAYLKATQQFQQVYLTYNIESISDCPISTLADAVLRDWRVAHDWDRFWPEKVLVMRWMKLKFNEGFRGRFIERLSKKGWKGAHESLSVTVKCWIVQSAVVQEKFSTERIEYLGRAIRAIKWARSLRPSIKLECGHDCDIGNCGDYPVLEPRFLLAVQRLHMETIMKIGSARNLRKEPDCPYLEEVFKEADEVFDIAVDLRRENCEEADVVAFQDLPRATALAAKGFYYFERSMFERRSKDLRLSFEFYKKAAKCLPKDDDQRVLYLGQGLECMKYSGTRVDEQLEIVAEVKSALEDIVPIWGIGHRMCDEFEAALGSRKVKRDEEYRWPQPSAEETFAFVEEYILAKYGGNQLSIPNNV
ncbi:hypothetical protein VNI00_007028 [Paramarasmius palmivorus]|uniref:Uncharacterized protein n=1 Tax=Paramarasmius palmivorus TaxID=297713 RepID=A0AAW0D2Y4_9AGAR